MFNVQVLNDAVANLSDEGKAELQKMINIFEEYKQEVERLTEVAEGFEQLSKNLQRDKENLELTVKEQAARISGLTRELKSIEVEIEVSRR